MSATRKDFNAIARAIAPQYAYAMAVDLVHPDALVATVADYMLRGVVDGLRETNPAFDASHFRQEVKRMARNLTLTGDLDKAA